METFDVIDACAASAKDFCETLLFCLEEDGIFTNEDGSLDEEYKKDYKEYLDSVLEMHYNTDIGEQGENLVSYCEGKDAEQHSNIKCKNKIGNPRFPIFLFYFR